MDSIEAKTQQFQTSLQSLYTDSGVEKLYKGILDYGNNIIKTFTDIPKFFNLPILAVGKLGTQFTNLASLVTNAFAIIKTKLSISQKELGIVGKIAAGERLTVEEQAAAQEIAINDNKFSQLIERYIAGNAAMTQADIDGSNQRISAAQKEAQERLKVLKADEQLRAKQTKGGMIASAIGLGLSTIAGGIDVNKDHVSKGLLSAGSAVAQSVGTYFTMGGGVVGGIMAAITAVTQGIEALNILFGDSAREAQRLKEAATEANNAFLQKKSEYKSFDEQIKKLKELEKAQYDSEEARKAFIEASNEIAATNPELVSGYDLEGNALIDLTRSYYALEEARKAATKAAKDSATSSVEEADKKVEEAENNRKAALNSYKQRISQAYTTSKTDEFFQIAEDSGIVFNDKDRAESYLKQLQSPTANINTIIGQLQYAMDYQNYDKLFEIFKDKGTTLYEFLENSIQRDTVNIQKISDLFDDNSDEQLLMKKIEDSLNSDDTEGAIKYINEHQKKIDNIRKKIKEDSDEGNDWAIAYLDSWMEINGEVTKVVADEVKTSKARESLIKQKISSVTGVLLSGEDSSIENAYLEKMESANNFITEFIYNKQKDSEDFETYINSSEFDEDLEEIQGILSNFWNNVLNTQTVRDSFNELIKNSNDYSWSQMYYALKDLAPEADHNTLMMMINSIYGDDLSSIYNNFYNAVEIRLANESEQLNNVLSNISSNSNFGSADYSAIISTYDKLFDLVNSNNITDKYAAGLFEQYTSLWELSNGIKNIADREQVQKLLQGIDLSSLSTVLSFLEDIDNLEVDESTKEVLAQIKKEAEKLKDIPVNLNTEIQSYTAAMTAGMEDFEKAISNASKGMDFKTASELAGKIGKSISDFDLRDGKFYFDDLSTIEEAYLGAAEQSRKSVEEAANKIKNTYSTDANKRILQFLSEEINSKEDIDKIINNFSKNLTAAGIDPNQLKIYYQEYFNDVNKSTQTFVDWIGKHIDDELKESLDLIDDYIQDLEARTYLSSGNISKFLDTVLGEISGEGAGAEAARDNRELLKQQLVSGNYEIEDIPEQLRSWITLIQTTFKDAEKNVFDSAIASLTKGEQIINVTEGNEDLLRSLSDFVTISDDGKQAFINAAGKDIETIRTAVLTSSLPDEEINSILASLHKEEYKDNVYTALSNVIDKFDNFSYEAGQALATALGGDDINALIEQGVITEDTAGNLSTTYEQMRDYLNSNIQNMTIEEYNDLRAKLEAANYKQSDEAVFANIIKNRESLSTENIEELAKILGTTYDAAKSLLKDNGNGTYTLDLTQIQNIINWGRVEVTDETKELLASDIDNIVSSISNIIENQPKGFTNLADMQKYVEDINKTLPNANYNFQDIFEYNDVLHAYQLSTIGLVAQIGMMKELIASITEGENAILDEEYAEQLKRDVIRGFAEQIDISGYLNLDDNDPEKARKLQEVISAIDAYNNAVEELGTGTVLYADTIVEDLEKGGEKAIGAARKVAEAAGDTLSSEEIESAYNSDIASLEAAFDQLSFGVGAIVSGEAKSILETIDTFDLHDLGDGTAVIETIGDVTEAYRTYYKRLKDTNVATVASLNEAMAKILEKEDDADVISALGDAANMTYTRLGEILASKGIELTSDFIKQYQDVFESIGGGKLRIINFEKFATEIMGWTDIDVNSEEYVSAFKTYNDGLIELNHKVEETIADEIKAIGDAKAGDWVNLTKLYSELQKAIVPDWYNGNVDLKNRPLVSGKDLRAKGWDAENRDIGTINGVTYSWDEIKGMPEHMMVSMASITEDGLVKSYDELQEYLEELVGEAGEEINIDELKKLDSENQNLMLDIFISEADDIGEAIQEAEVRAEDLHNKQTNLTDFLNSQLEQYGAFFDDGILKLSDDANIPAIIYTLTQQAEENGLLLEDTMAELADTLNEVLENYTNLISGGIEGKLTNAQAQQLQTQAKSYGFNDELDFKKTADGLKLSETSARNLYLHLKQIDSLRANLVFNKLDESLKKSNEHYKDIFTITSRIAELNKEINNPKISTARRDEYKKELEVAKEIQETRSLTDPDTFNFMDQDLPDSLKGADNFWKSARKAYVSMNQAGENGYMAFQDWYNLAHFIEDSAITAGTTIEFAGQQIGEGASTAADLIERGAKALANVDDEGSVVSFKRLGTSFKNGAQDMSKDFDVAIKTTAKAQINMLDAMIAMLETVVAFDKFNELDTGFDGLEFNEIFVEPYMKSIKGLDTEVTRASDEASKTAKEILKQADTNKDLKDGLQQIKVDGISLYRMLGDIANQTELNKDKADKYYKTMAVWAEAAKSGDYSTENLTKIIQDTFAGYEGTTTVEIKGRKFVISDDMVFEADKNGRVTFDGRTYSNPNDAAAAYKYKEKYNLDQAFVKQGKVKGTVTLKDNTVVVYENNLDDKETEPKFTVDNVSYKTKEEAVNALYKKQTGKTRGNGFDPEFNEWLYSSEARLAFNISFSEASMNFNGDISKLTDEALEKAGIDLSLVYGVEVAIEKAFRNINIAQMLIDGLTSSLQVNTQTGDFTENPAITALGRNLGRGMAKGIAEASETGITDFFDVDTNKKAIAKPIKSGLQSAANSAEVKDTDYTIDKATATLKKMEINQVDEAGFSSSTLGSLMKAVRAIAGGSSSDLTLNSATAAIKKLSIVSVGQTDLKSQIQVDINAKVGTVDVTNLTNAKQEITNTITSVTNALTTLKNRIGDLNTNSTNANTNVGKLKTTLMGVANSQGPTKAEDFKKSLNNINQTGSDRAEDFKKALNNLGNYGPDRANKFVNALNNLGNWGSSYASSFVKAVNNLKDYGGRAWGFVDAVNALKHGKLTITVYDNGSHRTSWNWAKGNVALSKGTPNQALATGSKKTLVGELGPELVVSNGRYYVVGQNGAEMVDLPDDAIVFNHLQTKRLLGNGKGGRGKPVTNEKNAVSYATGNVSGPAMASAASVLATLKELRAMWQAMLTATAKQLGSLAGKSKPKDKKDNNNDNGDGTTTADDGTRIKTTTAEIQRWYNLLRQIDKTEKDITYQEKLQTQYQSLRVADGKSLYKSYKDELSMLDDQIKRSKELATIQKSWYDAKRAELAASAYGKIFTYTEDGLQQYVSGAGKGLDLLEQLYEKDIYGNPTGYARTAATQMQLLQNAGFDLNELLSNSDGTKAAGRVVSINTIYDENGKVLEGQDLIDAQVAIVKNFEDNLEGYREELDGLYDSYREQLEKALDNQNKMNEIMQKIVDNQIEVENKVYDALVDARQAIIDNAQKEIDAYQKNSDDMIDSLNKTLDKERQLYDNQKNSNDLLKLQRQLAILQRSGGSTSQILSLQQQIATKQQDMYFDEKEEQIQALQEASDLQLEKMQEQVNLMTETLEYEKENGLLWKEVYAVMQRTPEEILGFISNNAADWGSKSVTQATQDISSLKTIIELYTSSRDDDFINYYNDISSDIKDIANAETKKEDSSNNSNNNNNNNNNNSNNNNNNNNNNIVSNSNTSNSRSGSSSSNVKPSTTISTTTSAQTYKPSNSNNNYSSTATLTEGSTTVYKKSGGKFVLAHKSMGKTGAEVTILEENAGYYGNKQISRVEYKGKKYYIRNERLAYKQGGLIDFTGPAWVDGTPSEPESILNAKETKFVQNKLPNILNSVDTLQERLKDLQTLRAEWLSSISHVVDNSNNQNNSVNIEHVELNMNVEQMSSSADAKKLGREAFDELLNMARKAGKNSVSRR